MTIPNLTPASVTPAAPSGRAIVGLVVLTLGLRLLLLALVLGVREVPWAQFATHSDAASFLRMARVLVLGETPDQLSFYDRRIFPGWPLLFGGLLPIAPVAAVMLGSALAATALVPVLFLRLTRAPVTTGLVFAGIPPVWLISSAYPMAEPAFLLVGLGSLLALVHRAWFIAGLLGGLLCVIKPYGIFLAAGLAWTAWQDKRRLGSLVCLGSGALVPLAVAAGVSFARLGDIAPQFGVYAADLGKLNIHPLSAERLGGASGHWGWPFAALVSTPLRVPTPLWKTVYVYAHAAGSIYLAVRAWRRRAEQTEPWERACRIWLFGNVAASFCAGPYWGFHAFDRYAMWAWPAAAALNRDLFSRRLWLATLPVSFAAAAWAMLSK